MLSTALWETGELSLSLSAAEKAESSSGLFEGVFCIVSSGILGVV